MTAAELIRDLQTELDRVRDNLTATQARCTELVLENRALESTVDGLRHALEKMTDADPIEAEPATNVVDAATWLDDHCKGEWYVAAPGAAGVEGWWAHGNNYSLHGDSHREARELLARALGWPGPKCQHSQTSAGMSSHVVKGSDAAVKDAMDHVERMHNSAKRRLV